MLVVETPPIAMTPYALYPPIAMIPMELTPPTAISPIAFTPPTDTMPIEFTPPMVTPPIALKMEPATAPTALKVAPATIPTALCFAIAIGAMTFLPQLAKASDISMLGTSSVCLGLPAARPAGATMAERYRQGGPAVKPVCRTAGARGLELAGMGTTSNLRAAALVLSLCALTAIAAAGCLRDGGAGELERRAQEINSTVMCPVCPGESIDQSQNPLAARMRGIVMDRLSQGWTERQIKEHFVESYGDSVLLAPPARGISLLAWILPPVGAAAAVAAVFLAMRAMRRGREDAEVLKDAELTEEEYARYAETIERAVTDREARP